MKSVAIAVLLLAIGTPAPAQDHTHPPPAAAAPGWQWHVEGTAFVGANVQERRFRDFNAWESQNWLMLAAERPVGPAQLQLSSMFSFEPFTLADLGSAQVFQTGETFGGAPLIDYQHPHDLLMRLGGELRIAVRRATVFTGADLVGSPTLGPQAFMHRASASENPQAPLSHHHLDATHITPGVVRGGVEIGVLRLEASVFRGREPDENRLDVDLGALDSYAVRVAWNAGNWSGQASTGWLAKPEVVTPYDATRVTASVGYLRGDDTRSLSWTAAFGQNREIHGNLEAYLLEGTLRTSRRDLFYTRLESVAKDILDVGFHPVNTFHPHRQSQVTALTFGYTRDIVDSSLGNVGVGADLTGYVVPSNLKDSYGQPVSFHVFMRVRGAVGRAVHRH